MIKELTFIVVVFRTSKRQLQRGQNDFNISV